MSSDSLKPLIFVSPLSETLKKLKEAMEPNAEAQGIEIYVAENMDEACQLIPTVGQSVTLMSHPKHCALTLQKNKKYFKRMNSKMILLSPKSIPRKTLDKFMKVGLTECVVEPVNPKTLLYKVNLQLKSIVTQQEETEMNRKFEQDTAEKQAQEMALKKGQTSQNTNQEQEKEIREKKSAEEIEMENYSKVQKKEHQEEAIDTHYKGKQKQSEESLEDEEQEKSKNKYEEEEIDTYYKGDLTKAIDIEDDTVAKKKSISEDIEIDEMEALRSQISIEVEDDVQKKNSQAKVEAPLEAEKKKKGPQLDLEEDSSKAALREKQVEDLGGHYKGEVTKGLDIEDDESNFKEKKEADELSSNMHGSASPSLDIEDDNLPEISQELGDESYLEEREKTAGLEIEEDLENKDKTFESEEIIDEDQKDLKLDDEEPLDVPDPLKAPSLNIEEDKDQKERKEEKVDEIDKYLRSKSAQKLKVDEQEDYKESAKEKTKERDELPESDSLSLDVVDDKKQKMSETEELEEFDPLKKEAVHLDLQDDKKSKKSLENEEELQEKDYLRKKNELQLDEDYQKKDLLKNKEKDNRGINKTDARADHIKTHYSSKESIKHNDDNWDSKWEKRQKEEEDFPKSHEEKELHFDKLDRGEQTINYEKLKDEFDAISYDRIPKKGKISTEYDGPVATKKTYGKTVFSELEQANVEIQVEEIAQGQEESTSVFEPEPLGIDTAILVLNHYMKDEIDLKQLCRFISTQIEKQYQGQTTFFKYESAQGSYQPLYLHEVDNLLGEMPIKPSEKDKEGLNKSELKILMKEYDNDLLAYNQQKNELQGEWDQKFTSDLSEWKEAKTPLWKDHTFQSNLNYYVVPFFEGKEKLGFAVVSFSEPFNPDLEKPLEVMMETARGLFLNQVQRVTTTSQKSKTSTKSEKEKDKKGFLSSLWKKVAS